MNPIDKLTEYFREFPGIGPRQARRFVYYLLTRSPAMLGEISRLILEIKKEVHVCSQCYRFYTTKNLREDKAGGKHDLCQICSDQNRNQAILMIVSKDADLEAVEKASVYQGLYFVLGGVVPILEKDPDKRVRTRELTSRIKDDKNLTEIILSMSATPDGEHTAETVRSIIKTLKPEKLAITILGRGLSTGSELEYSDTDTIQNAFKNRA